MCFCRRSTAADLLKLPFFSNCKAEELLYSTVPKTDNLVTPSVRCILGAAKSAKWMLASNIKGIESEWQQLNGTNVKHWQHDYVTTSGSGSKTDGVASAALEEVWNAIENVPGN